MPGRIRHSDIEEVKARTNIADVVGEYVQLKPAGIGSLKGLCPFHDERSPSFHVRPQLGYYHCFGCGESGDVYSFLQALDHVTFAEAVEKLAARVGYVLTYEDGGAQDDAERGQRTRLLAANKAAEEFFVQRLTLPDAEPGRRFLGERGFDAAAASRFGVGYAPKAWDELTNHLRAKGFTPEVLAAAGLVSQGDRGIYDRFRGRVVWPIRDVTGQTLGFGARRLFDDDQGPKYLNTPETAVYHKAQVLYGLDLAKRDIGRGHQVVVVEGYTDVMACHLAGITTAVATCGTAFGADHVRMLRRMLGDEEASSQVVFTFDPDAAGQKAAERSWDVIQETRIGAQTYVAVGPDGLDPCDLRLAQGDAAIVRMIDEKRPMFEFILRQTVARFDLSTLEGRIGALRAAAPVIAELKDTALRPGYTRELARMTGAELTEAEHAVTAAGRQRRDSADPAHRRPLGGAETSGLSREGGSPPPAAGGETPAIRASNPAGLFALATDPVTRLERDALMGILQQPELVGRDLAGQAAEARFANQSLQVVRDAIAANLDSYAESGWFAKVLADVPAPLAGLVQELAVAPLPVRDEAQLAGFVRGAVAALVEKDLLGRKAELQGRLQRSDPVDVDGRATLQRAMADIEQQRRAVRGE
ncbi:DNA primase [Gryllotalpicola sp.]|uniref:DNA primase n=1 Tax=Gryllotalpicola sp. TaxID=1932787 RepID=UPI002614F4D0|nr:DNA primase [Gryllotalpicola sp.]